jgi:hypothetical protein
MANRGKNPHGGREQLGRRPQRRREAQRGGAERRRRGQDVAAWSGDRKSGRERSGAEPGRLVILKSGVIHHGIRGPTGKAKLATRQRCLARRIVRLEAKCAPCNIFEMVCGRAIEPSEGQSRKERSRRHSRKVETIWGSAQKKQIGEITEGCLARRIVRLKAKCAPCNKFEMVCWLATKARERQSNGEAKRAIEVVVAPEGLISTRKSGRSCSSAEDR